MAIELKVLVDKEKNRVVFAESDSNFVEALFGFLTIPMATIMKHARNRSRTEGLLSCMHNLYESVVNLDVNLFQDEACKEMLLNPCNASESFCKNLKTKDLCAVSTDYYFCCRSLSSCKSLSRYGNTRCTSGHPMIYKRSLTSSSSASQGRYHAGVFVKGMMRFAITDDLQLLSFYDGIKLSFFSKLEIAMDWSTMEERIFSVKPEGVLDMLLCSLVSRTPLTEILLENKSVAPVHRPYQSGNAEWKRKNINQEGNVAVKLIVSKSKKLVCYAEAKGDFINLLLSFLAVPLGHVLKQDYNGSLNGCIGQLYKSVHDLDEQCFISSCGKEMLVSPMVAPGYKNDLLGIKEAPYPEFYYSELYCDGDDDDCYYLTTDKSPIPSGYSSEIASVTVLDPKSKYNNGEHGEVGFLSDEAMFTVTDGLIIKPISAMLSLSILNGLKVPFSDTEEQIVHVGKEQATLLLLHASLVSKSALTSAFIH